MTTRHGGSPVRHRAEDETRLTEWGARGKVGKCSGCFMARSDISGLWCSGRCAARSAETDARQPASGPLDPAFTGVIGLDATSKESTA